MTNTQALNYKMTETDSRETLCLAVVNCTHIKIYFLYQIGICCVNKEQILFDPESGYCTLVEQHVILMC